MGDIFPEFGNGAAGGIRRQKRPAKGRNPQTSEETWSGIGHTPKWVRAGMGVPALTRGETSVAGRAVRPRSGHAFREWMRRPS